MYSPYPPGLTKVIAEGRVYKEHGIDGISNFVEVEPDLEPEIEEDDGN
jgi:hypothetical protein